MTIFILTIFYELDNGVSKRNTLLSRDFITFISNACAVINIFNNKMQQC